MESIQTETIQMTPEMAAEILDNNNKNRHLRKPQVEFHLNNINRGLWELTHQGVAIDRNGNLLDGQHRLEAIRLSGKSVPIMVSRGMDPNLMQVIDTGARRSPGDVFKIADIPNPAVTSAMVRAVMNYRQDRWTNEVIPHSSLIDYYGQDEKVFAQAVEITKGEHKQVGMSPSLLAACVYLTLCSSITDERRAEWLPMAIHGINLRKGEPAYLLRRQFMNLRSDQRRMPSRAWMGMYAKAFTIWALDQRVPQYLRFMDTDPLPSIEQPGAKIQNPFKAK